jgi:uncharacterized Zn finger protein
MDLQIRKGVVEAMVSGSSIYRVVVKVAALPPARWAALRREATDSIASLVDLLQGRFSRGVMETMCREGTGLFPSRREITFSCSCPDYAGLCKHIAATLYGVGARLDASPELLFVLRGVDSTDLVTGVAADSGIGRRGKDAGDAVAEEDLGAVFGIEMEAKARSVRVPGGNEGREGVAGVPASREAKAGGGAARRKPRGKAARRRPATKRRGKGSGR